MIIIACLDNANGMMFNHRRQSRDQAVVNDISMITERIPLYMDEYSYPLFQNTMCKNIRVSPKFLQKAKKDDYCFIENKVPSYETTEIQKLILYKWNRTYPADLYFDFNDTMVWKLIHMEEFMGTSHEKITKEIYIK